jgi:hypothetical protein
VRLEVTTPAQDPPRRRARRRVDAARLIFTLGEGDRLRVMLAVPATISSAAIERIVQVPESQVRELVEIAVNPAALATVLRALEMGLFDRAPSRSEGSVAPVTDAPLPRPSDDVALEMTLELCRGLGLLEESDAGFRPTPLAAAFLMPDAPLPLRGLLERHALYLGGFAAAERALRHMHRVQRPMWSRQTSRSEQEAYFAIRQSFNEASRRYYTDTAALLLRAHLSRDLSRHRVACDFASGPGAFAALLKAARPELRVLAADVSHCFEPYRRASERWLAERGAMVECLGLNLLYDPLPTRVDLLTVNRLLSGLARDGARPWAEQMFDALEPGGAVVVVDFMTTGEPVHDRILASLRLMVMAWNQHVFDTGPPSRPVDDPSNWGWHPDWSCREAADLLASVGFQDVLWRRATPPFALVEARRP